jgi:type 1 glutamine amidotransferase
VILVFSRTTGFRHDSIPAGIETVRSFGYPVDATEDPDWFTPERLSRYQAVVFMNTNGTVLDDAGRAAFEGYVRGGGGFMGVHSATATEYNWPFYGAHVGAFFDKHPEVQPATVTVVDHDHPATAHLPATWSRVDEWYDFRTRPEARVLLRLDETTYTGGGMGADHPLAWCHEHGGGRAFYTALGHTIEGYDEPAFREHLLGGLRWAAGLV